MKLVKTMPNGEKHIQEVIDCPCCKERKYDDLGVYSQYYQAKICSECASKQSINFDTSKIKTAE